MALRASSALPALTCFSAWIWTSLRSQASKVTAPLILVNWTWEPAWSGTVRSKLSYRVVDAPAAVARSSAPRNTGRIFFVFILVMSNPSFSVPYETEQQKVTEIGIASARGGREMSGRPMTDDLELLLQVLPPAVRASIEPHPRRGELVELVLDLGRLPEARFPDAGEFLSDQMVGREDLAYVVERVGRFGKDNRAGIERTLHRISAIRNRVGDVIGLTCRVGRAVFGTVDILRDVIEAGQSILLLGRPGVGKTTILREAARVLADDLSKRVIVVDTSNEIAGDGDVPHPGIGRARRMQVPSPDEQHGVMIEAVENHMPQVIVIDEIGTAAEALAARTIAERGVQLIATAHGNTLENLLQNPTLSDLVGGIQAVTLSDEEARRRGTQKTVLERKAPPTFGVLIEIQDKDRLAVHHDVAEVVDRLLRDVPPRPELRTRTAGGAVEIQA